MTAVSNTVRTPVGFAFSSGNYKIDDLLAGAYWGGKLGGAMTLSYSFPTSADIFTPGYGNAEPLTGFAGMNVEQQATFVKALDAWASVANLHFTLVPDGADSYGEIRAAFTTTKAVLDALAYAYTPRSTNWAGDVWLNGTSNWTNLANGSYNFMALMHEVGHALGLSHPFGGSSAFGGSLPTEEDNYSNTIMAYNAVSGSASSRANTYATTPMSYDIAAMQYLYGANMSYHTGDDSYTFEQGSKYFQTIWDAGGSDTIVWKASAAAGVAAEGAAIDLRPGAWSDLGDAIAYRDKAGNALSTSNLTVQIYATVTIENATGGDGADTLTGNDVANVLTGGAGNDTLSGGAGDDQLLGGADIDTAVYTAARTGYTITRADDGTLTVSGGEGKDTLAGMERLKFADGGLALDMAHDQAGGKAALLLGALRGTAGLADAAEVGKLLAYLSTPGANAALPSIYEAAGFLMNAADYPAAADSTSSRTLVTVLFKNLTGTDIDAATLQVFASLLDDHLVTQPLLLGMVADLPLNWQQVGLVGLGQTGLVYA